MALRLALTPRSPLQHRFLSNGYQERIIEGSPFKLAGAGDFLASQTTEDTGDSLIGRHRVSLLQLFVLSEFFPVILLSIR